MQPFFTGPRGRRRVGPGRAAIVVAVVVFAAFGTAHAGSTTTTLMGPSSGAVYGEKAMFAATVHGRSPSGKVKLMDGSKSVGTATAGVVIGTGAPVGAGKYHTCAVTSKGAAKCWGYNYEGELGDGTYDQRETPVQVQGLKSGVVAVAAGDYHSCALTRKGAVKCWGYNRYGQLGDGSKTNSNTPVQVSGLSSGVVAISAGAYHTCAITAKGGAKCWGYNNYGQVGDAGTITSDRPLPRDVHNLTSGAVAISAADYHTCALTYEGSAKCWGRGGRTGDGGTTLRLGPVQVTGLETGVAAIAAGGAHTCALTMSGGVKCWGSNSVGQVGDNSTTDRLEPAQVYKMKSGVAAVAGGRFHSCAVTVGGAVKCWGFNNYGQLGNGTMTNSAVPIQVGGLASGFVNLGLWGWHSCALRNVGKLFCWGYNGYGAIGDNTTDDRKTPVAVSGFGSGKALVSAVAAIKTSALKAGKHKLTARYVGDSGNGASTSRVLNFVVDKGRTKVKSVTVQPKKPKKGKTATVEIVLGAVSPARGKPNGKVQIKDGSKKLGTVSLKNGAATFKWKKPTKGTHKLKFAYAGNANWKKSAATEKVTVR